MDLIFISSPQAEFVRFRKELCYFILTDPYLSQYFDVFIFENLPANQRNPENNYLNKVEECSIYLGLFGRTYGRQNDDGISATESEYNRATDLNKDRLIYLKNLYQGKRREAKMRNLVNKVAGDVTYTTFRTLSELKCKVIQSLLYWQQNQLN